MENQKDIKKLLMYFIHEHSNGLSFITNTIASLRIELESGREITSEFIQKKIDFLQIGKNRCKESVDYLYTELKDYNKK